MTLQDACIQAYQKHRHLKLAAEDVGIPWQTVYTHLRRAGFPVTGDKSKYGSDSDRFAAKSEADLIRFIPYAIDQNRHSFQSKMDFDILGYGADVKASRPQSSNKKAKTRRWCFSVKKQEIHADFFVCFAYSDDLEIVHCLLIPGEIARHYISISLSPNGKKWWDYLISPSDLSEFFTNLPSRKMS